LVLGFIFLFWPQIGAAAWFLARGDRGLIDRREAGIDIFRARI